MPIAATSKTQMIIVITVLVVLIGGILDYFMVSGSTNFGASAATVPQGFFTSERTSTAGEAGGGGVVERVAVVVSVATLTATDSVEAVETDEAWVVAAVSVVVQPGNATTAYSTPSAKKNFSMPIIPIAPFQMQTRPRTNPTSGF
jgi:hypothetical protein